MKIIISNEIKEKIPDLFVVTKEVHDIVISAASSSLQKKKEQLLSQYQGQDFSILDNISELLTYRKLQEKFGFDPAKNPSAVEAMYVRGIFKNRFPTINTAVDAANIVSVETFIPIGLFDADQILGDITFRLAEDGDKYTPIGGQSGLEKIKKGSPILEDLEKVFSVIGNRDSQ